MTSEHDKVLDHTRLQLSALFDGELAVDEARFLKRRLEHDGELAGCWSRWQLAGDVLRGQATAPAPAGFAESVAAAVSADAGTRDAVGAHRRRYWVPGAALAASVAALAMFMTRQAPEVVVPAAPTMEIASSGPAPSVDPVPQAPTQAPDRAAQVAAAVAVAEVPRRAAERRSRAQQQRAATTRAVRNEDAPRRVAMAERTPAPAMVPVETAANPFAADAAAGAITARPWPRALLPNAGGAFNVGYGNLQPAPTAFQQYAPFSREPASRATNPEDVD